MKFKTRIKMLEHWLKIASTALGKSAATQTVDGYYFRKKDGMLEIVGTDKKNFAFARTSIQLEKEGEPFALRASVLDTLINYSSPDAEVLFEVVSHLDDGDSAVVRVECGDYVGKSLVSLSLANFPENFPAFDYDQPLLLNIDGFCQSISRVKYVAEGISTSQVKKEVVFKRGKCWVGTAVRYQEVDTGFDKNVDVSVPFEALRCVKLLELLRQKHEDTFSFAESDTFLYFSVGNHCFVSGKAERAETDKQKEFDGFLIGKKALTFEIMTASLYRAVVLASATCEQSSAEITFEFEKDKLFVIGKDRHDNSAYVQLDVHIKADTQKVLERVSGAGWHWLVSAIMATGGKSLSVRFDKHFVVFESEKSRGFCPLLSKHNVDRTIAGKSA